VSSAEKPEVTPLKAGEIFHDRYEVVRCLKSGGMGAIYEVIHLDTRRRRALKTMLPSLLADEDLRERFAREATVAAEIESEHIVETFDAGVDAKTKLPFLVMELLKGEDLGAMVERRGKLAGLEVVGLLYQAALALNKTHAAGIVHRDLKPENLFVVKRDDGSPRLKLLDFGIAKLVAHGPLVKTTRLVGSPLYMSTEQIKGEGTIGPRADLYSLGHIAYTLLVGEAYWERESKASEAIYPLLLKIMLGAKESATERAKSRGVELPPAFDAWFAKASNADPDERCATASELVDTLADALDLPRPRGTLPEDEDAPVESAAAPKSSERPPPVSAERNPAAPNTMTDSAVAIRPPGASRRRVPIAVAVVFVALGVISAWAIHRSPEAPPPVDSAAHASVDVVPVPSATAIASAAPSSQPIAVVPESNPWVRVDPPPAPMLLGVGDDGTPLELLGFRPSRGIYAPTAPYQMQAHEVTWEELEPWLAQHGGRDFDRPSWVPKEGPERAKLPATGIPWTVARGYCKDLGGSLPTEEQWEYAARGPERRPHAWGNKRLDLLRVRAFSAETPIDVGSKIGVPIANVMTMDQDRTPGDPGAIFYDLAGNAMEWTEDLYRESSPGVDESWSERGGLTYRAVRGLPPDGSMPHKIPTETAAWRTPLCATGPCPKSAIHTLEVVGFRCAKEVVEKHAPTAAAAAQAKSAPPPPTASAAAPPAKGTHDAHSKSGAAAPQRGAILKDDSPNPPRPSPGALSAVLGVATGAARACVTGASYDTFATLTFVSSGKVSSVNVTGWANANGKRACVQAAFSRARVSPFTDPSYTTRVTVHP
jgi:eukaryotic-like serine/threonine-protein kinase